MPFKPFSRASNRASFVLVYCTLYIVRVRCAVCDVRYTICVVCVYARTQRARIDIRYGTQMAFNINWVKND